MRQCLAMVMQVGAAVRHLHAHGIVHRDIRAANVLVKSMEPLALKLSDFGVSYQRPRVGDGDEHGVDGGGGLTVVSGDDAVGPVWCMAPEVIDRDAHDGRVASTHSDVYMLGGLMFEVLTGGRSPYFWIHEDTRLGAMLACRRAPPHVVVALGGGVSHAGLRGLSTLAAAARDGVAVPWHVSDDSGAVVVLAAADADASQHATVLAMTVELVAACLHETVGERPSMTEVQNTLARLSDMLPAPTRGVGVTAQRGFVSSDGGYPADRDQVRGMQRAGRGRGGEGGDSGGGGAGRGGSSGGGGGGGGGGGRGDSVPVIGVLLGTSSLSVVHADVGYPGSPGDVSLTSPQSFGCVASHGTETAPHDAASMAATASVHVATETSPAAAEITVADPAGHSATVSTPGDASDVPSSCGCRPSCSIQ
jgi:uncharacterized membrane protein YgcG